MINLNATRHLGYYESSPFSNRDNMKINRTRAPTKFSSALQEQPELEKKKDGHSLGFPAYARDLKEELECGFFTR
ncbi:hypothetical protein PoB_004681800 [Plakobranchus ocellatus]|uniref:Uncharacterized protein n=1 Tax=Plakobranchus ocellatus TaxID=259542 RepID=A0AAV4BMC4_9GAST|nr:hypothetical protein PoB_004681800 [Plakobranchus ocellatus]